MISRWIILLTSLWLAGCMSQVRHQQETLTELKQFRSDLATHVEPLMLSVRQNKEETHALRLELEKLQRQIAKVQKHNAEVLSQLTQLQQTQRMAQAEEMPRSMVAEKLSQDRDKVILGSREWVWIDNIDQHLKARIDTGATTSSISAVNQVQFERNGEKWIRFDLTTRKQSFTVEAPILRWAQIQQASSETPEKRAVVELWIQVGKLRQKVEFTLSDRRNMRYPLLMGREFFKDIALIDVGRSYIQGKARTENSAKRNSAKPAVDSSAELSQKHSQKLSTNHSGDVN